MPGILENIMQDIISLFGRYEGLVKIIKELNKEIESLKKKVKHLEEK